MLTEGLAIWGAVVSTVALVWNILRATSDRGKIKVTIGLVSVERSEIEQKEPRVAENLFKGIDSNITRVMRARVTLINVGNRPITIAELKFLNSSVETIKVGKRFFHLKNRSWSSDGICPFTLKEAEAWSLDFVPDLLVRTFEGIEVLDAKGGVYLLPLDEVARLKKEVENLHLSEEEREKVLLESVQLRRVRNKFSLLWP